MGRVASPRRRDPVARCVDRERDSVGSTCHGLDGVRRTSRFGCRRRLGQARQGCNRRRGIEGSKARGRESVRGTACRVVLALILGDRLPRNARRRLDLVGGESRRHRGEAGGRLAAGISVDEPGSRMGHRAPRGPRPTVPPTRPVRRAAVPLLGPSRACSFNAGDAGPMATGLPVGWVSAGRISAWCRGSGARSSPIDRRFDCSACRAAIT